MGIIGRTVVLAVVWAALGAVAGAEAQCTGDCNADGSVAINELILGVNIALGAREPSACTAFQDSTGNVNISQLIRAVTFALNGCPPPGTQSAAPTATATPEAPTPTPPVAGSPSATATAVSSATGTATTAPTAEPIGSHQCTLRPGNTASHLGLYRAGFSAPSLVPLRGSITLDCSAAGPDGRAQCTCEAGAFDPIVLGGVAKFCVLPSEQPCPSAPIACAGGGAPLGLTLDGNGNISSCADNAACAASCETACETTGRVAIASGCTGYCSAGTMRACNNDAACRPNDGVCNGADSVSEANRGHCQCQCLDTASGSAPGPGELQCLLRWKLVAVAPMAACTDAPMFTAPLCTLLTTATASAGLRNVNYGTGSIPASGTLSNTGAPVTCDMLQDGALTNLKLRGAFGAFGGVISDVLSEIFIECL